MSEVVIKKSKMDIGEAKDIENSIANAEKFQAFMDYIAACDHPEIFEDVEMEGFENEQINLFNGKKILS